MLARVAANYDRTRDEAEPVAQDQPWKGAFSKRLPQIGQSARGFDAAKLSALNPGASDGAQVSEQYYVFRQPSDSTRFYRVDFIATPYYLFSSAPITRTSTDGTIAYKSSAEAMASESTSLGVDVGVGDTKLFSLGMTNSSSRQSSGSSESVLALHRSRDLKYVLTLDRRWIELNPNFVERALAEADRVIAGDNNPPPFHNLFENFGTHYANAITYGAQTGSVEVLDETTLGNMTQSGSSIKASLKVPIPETPVAVGLEGGQEKETKAGGEAGVRKESRASIEVGSDADPVPIFLDLRPLWELLQPPYLGDERMRRTIDAARAGWQQYRDRNTRALPQWEAPLLFQARLKSIAAIGAETCFVRGRAFLAAIASGSDWSLVAPADPARRAHATPVWANAASQPVGLVMPYVPAATPVATLPIPRSGAVPAIGFTGSFTAMHQQAIAAEVESHHPWIGGGGFGGIPARAPASPAEIAAEEQKLAAGMPALDATGTDWIGFDALGKPLAQSATQWTNFFADEFDCVVFREKLKLAGLPPGPTFSTQSIVVGNKFAISFDVRVVDPLGLLDDSAAAQYKFV